MNQFEGELDSRLPDTVIKLTYEELYVYAALQKVTLKRTLDFLGVCRIQSHDVNKLLDKSRSQMNSPKTYRWVRNYSEINEVGISRATALCLSNQDCVKVSYDRGMLLSQQDGVSQPQVERRRGEEQWKL
jgi:hypothetical protein